MRDEIINTCTVSLELHTATHSLASIESLIGRSAAHGSYSMGEIRESSKRTYAETVYRTSSVDFPLEELPSVLQRFESEHLLKMVRCAGEVDGGLTLNIGIFFRTACVTASFSPTSLEPFVSRGVTLSLSCYPCSE